MSFLCLTAFFSGGNVRFVMSDRGKQAKIVFPGVSNDLLGIIPSHPWPLGIHGRRFIIETKS